MSNRDLFQIEGIKSVFYGPDFITLTKVRISNKTFQYLFVDLNTAFNVHCWLLKVDDDIEWTDIKRHAVEVITNFYESGELIKAGVTHAESSEWNFD